jgi:DedD protein
MHDHNLDDLIIDNIEPKSSKTKSFLTIIALLIVVLIVAIVLTRVLLKTPNDNDLVFEQETAELIAPELKLQETSKPAKIEEAPELSSIIESKLKKEPVETKKPEIVQEPTVVVEKEKPKPEVKLPVVPKPIVPKVVETKKDPVLSNIQEEKIKAPVAVKEPSVTAEQKAKDAADIAHWEAVQEKRKAEEQIKEVQTEKIVQETTPTVKPAEPKKVDVPKVEKPKPVVQEVKKPVVQTPAPKNVSGKKYYVQVGSFKNQPSSRFISVIKNNGFKYRIIRSSTDGTKKLLIGPYENRASVNSALIQVKDRINKSAFVVKR